jgi:hypothetical protein
MNSEKHREVVREEMAMRSRHCVSCGRGIDWDSMICPYCGHDYRMPANLAHPRPDEPVSGGMRALFYILSILIPIVGIVIGAVYLMDPRQGHKRIGKVCMILGVVSLLLAVVISALLYAVVLNLGDRIEITPTAVLTRASIDSGCMFTIVAITSTVSWSDVSILLSDGHEMCEWHPSESALSDGTDVTQEFAPTSLGDLTVRCTVTDTAGNGRVDGSDCFTLTTSLTSPFSSATTYTVRLIYQPTGEAIASMHFSG